LLFYMHGKSHAISNGTSLGYNHFSFFHRGISKKTLKAMIVSLSTYHAK
jgi:hypothetical protein